MAGILPDTVTKDFERMAKYLRAWKQLMELERREDGK